MGKGHRGDVQLLRVQEVEVNAMLGARHKQQARSNPLGLFPFMPQTALISVSNKGKYYLIACACLSHTWPPSSPFSPTAMPWFSVFCASTSGWLAQAKPSSQQDAATSVNGQGVLLHLAAAPLALL